MDKSRPAREGAQMTAQDRARLQDALVVNPFRKKKHYTAWSMWRALALHVTALTNGVGPYRDHLVASGQDVALLKCGETVSYDTLSRELRGRGGKRETVRTVLERHGFTIVADGKVRVEVVS
jgi:hypothetical protein